MNNKSTVFNISFVIDKRIFTSMVLHVSTLMPACQLSPIIVSSWLKHILGTNRHGKYIYDLWYYTSTWFNYETDGADVSDVHSKSYSLLAQLYWRIETIGKLIQGTLKIWTACVDIATFSLFFLHENQGRWGLQRKELDFFTDLQSGKELSLKNNP